MLDPILDKAPVREQRRALEILGSIELPEADRALDRWLQRLQRGAVPAELQLDLIEAAEQRDNDAIQAQLQSYRDAKPKDDPLAQYIEALAGGNRQAGRKIYYERAAAQCQRCHMIGGGGGQTGPALDGVGKRLDRRALLRSLVDPGAEITPGYGSIVVTTKSGGVHAGILVAETDTSLRIQPPDGDAVDVPLDQIRERSPTVSAMPPMAAMLSKRDLRDVIEFLSNLK